MGRGTGTHDELLPASLMRIGIYLADQVWRRTRSKGIYSYSRTLVAELARRLADHALFLIVNRDNQSEMVPIGCHATAIVLPSALAAGIPRLVGDHLVAPWLARRLDLDLIHFPKGFTPELPAGDSRITATIHDVIPLWYAQHFPGYLSAWRIAYLERMYLGSLRRCHRIATDSEFSRGELSKLARRHGIAPPPIEVCYLSPYPQFTTSQAHESIGAMKAARTLLHLGSAFPHKRTRETVQWFRAFRRRRPDSWRLRVAGLEGPLPEWALAPGDDVEWLGTLDGPALRHEMQQAQALLLLSSIEGFGLPALESWFVGTPVCYSDAGSVGEILRGVPGRCSGDDQEVFERALDEVLSLDAEQRESWSMRLRERYSLERFGERSAAQFCEWIKAPTK